MSCFFSGFIAPTDIWEPMVASPAEEGVLELRTELGDLQAVFFCFFLLRLLGFRSPAAGEKIEPEGPKARRGKAKKPTGNMPGWARGLASPK